MSYRSCSLFGVCGYLRTRYPASLSRAARFVSSNSLFRWVPSSSSIIAMTLNVLSSRTKSALFRSNLFRFAYSVVSSSAPKLTSASTTNSGCGKDSTSLQNISCSLCVDICRGVSFPLDLVVVWVLVAAAWRAVAIAIGRAIRAMSAAVKIKRPFMLLGVA